MYAPWKQWFGFVWIGKRECSHDYYISALCLTQYLLNLQMIIVFANRYCTNLQNSYEFITESLIEVAPYVLLNCITLPPDLLCLSVEGWAFPQLWGWNSHCTFLLANPLLPHSSSSTSSKPLSISLVQPLLPANMAWPHCFLQSVMPPLPPLVSSFQVCLSKLMVSLGQEEFAQTLQ